MPARSFQRDSIMAYASGAVLNAPDLQTRTAQLKLQSGGRVSDKDYHRLTNRMSIEEENARTGGTAKGILTRATDPAAAYQSGVSRVGPAPTTPVARMSPPMQPGATPSPVRPQLAPQGPGPGAPMQPPIPTAPRTFSRPLFSGESGVIDGNTVAGGPVNRITAGPAAPRPQITPITNAQPSAVPQSPITPPSREQSNPMTGTAPNIPQGATQDIGIATPEGGYNAITGPSLHYGGEGEHRQGFRTPESAQIYDGYVRQLMTSAQPLAQPAPSVVQRAGPAPAPVNDTSDRDLFPRAIWNKPPSPGQPLLSKGDRRRQQSSPRVVNPQRNSNVTAAAYP